VRESLLRLTIDEALSAPPRTASPQGGGEGGGEGGGGGGGKKNADTSDTSDTVREEAKRLLLLLGGESLGRELSLGFGYLWSASSEGSFNESSDESSNMGAKAATETKEADAEMKETRETKDDTPLSPSLPRLRAAEAVINDFALGGSGGGKEGKAEGNAAAVRLRVARMWSLLDLCGRGGESSQGGGYKGNRAYGCSAQVLMARAEVLQEDPATRDGRRYRRYHNALADVRHAVALHAYYGQLSIRRFAGDAAYRRKAVLLVMRSMDVERVDRAREAGAHYGIDRWEMDGSRLLWLVHPRSKIVPVDGNAGGLRALEPAEIRKAVKKETLDRALLREPTRLIKLLRGRVWEAVADAPGQVCYLGVQYFQSISLYSYLM
jgi:hypothetical protein